MSVCVASVYWHTIDGGPVKVMYYDPVSGMDSGGSGTIGTNQWGNVLMPTTQSPANCTGYILQTAAEFSANSPQLTPAETLSLSMSVLAVWAVAWGFKVLRRTF